jgi:hypothetical protein
MSDDKYFDDYPVIDKLIGKIRNKIDKLHIPIGQKHIDLLTNINDKFEKMKDKITSDISENTKLTEDGKKGLNEDDEKKKLNEKKIFKRKEIFMKNFINKMYEGFNKNPNEINVITPINDLVLKKKHIHKMLKMETDEIINISNELQDIEILLQYDENISFDANDFDQIEHVISKSKHIIDILTNNKLLLRNIIDNTLKLSDEFVYFQSSIIQPPEEIMNDYDNIYENIFYKEFSFEHEQLIRQQNHYFYITDRLKNIEYTKKVIDFLTFALNKSLKIPINDDVYKLLNFTGKPVNVTRFYRSSVDYFIKLTKFLNDNFIFETKFGTIIADYNKIFNFEFYYDTAKLKRNIPNIKNFVNEYLKIAYNLINPTKQTFDTYLKNNSISLGGIAFEHIYELSTLELTNLCTDKEPFYNIANKIKDLAKQNGFTDIEFFRFPLTLRNASPNPDVSQAIIEATQLLKEDLANDKIKYGKMFVIQERDCKEYEKLMPGIKSHSIYLDLLYSKHKQVTRKMQLNSETEIQNLINYQIEIERILKKHGCLKKRQKGGSITKYYNNVDKLINTNTKNNVYFNHMHFYNKYIEILKYHNAKINYLLCSLNNMIQQYIIFKHALEKYNMIKNMFDSNGPFLKYIDIDQIREIYTFIKNENVEPVDKFYLIYTYTIKVLDFIINKHKTLNIDTKYINYLYVNMLFSSDNIKKCLYYSLNMYLSRPIK